MPIQADRKVRSLIGVLAVTAALMGAPALAQNVHYAGKLQIGFSDTDNTIPFGAQLNSGVPRCGRGETLTQPKTISTLLVHARGTQLTPGPGGELVFNAVGAGLGGAQVKQPSTCLSIQTPFLVSRIRSRTRVSSAMWPGNLGSFTSMISSQSTSTMPSETYRLAAGGGIPIPGAVFTATNPIFQNSALGQLTITRGVNHFGGGVPYQGKVAVQIGVNLTVATIGTIPAPTNFGQIGYREGLFSLPYRFGDGETGTSGFFIPTVGSVADPAHGLLVRHERNRVALRTPGGTTLHQHGAIRTLGGGNTATPAPTFMFGGQTLDCVTGLPMPCPLLTSPISARVAVFAWTTGRVRVTDMSGGFSTIRSAAGSDVAATGPAGTTRRLQLVSPWSAAFSTPGFFGIGAGLSDVFSGMAVLTLKVIPVPEPQLTTGLLGASAALLLAAKSRRRQPSLRHPASETRQATRTAPRRIDPAHQGVTQAPRIRSGSSL